MKPVYLSIQAFGSYHKKCEVDFTQPRQNIFLVTGNTGSGKTTIFNAIVYALYGERGSSEKLKSTEELQTQYGNYDLPPEVRFTFSQGVGQHEKQYTIRRVPAYKGVKKRGQGLTERPAEVEIRMPDGTYYTKREAEQKILDLVGLDKRQFMQVAMIAQGEYMNFLQADSKQKKLIFRELFHTGLYEKIEISLKDTLNRETQDRERQIKDWEREVNRIKFPNIDLEKEEELKRYITEKSVVYMELAIQTLRDCVKSWEQAWNGLQQKEKKETEVFQALTDKKSKGEQIEKAYISLEEACQKLKELNEQELNMNRLRDKAKKLDDAYRLKTSYKFYRDAAENVEKMQRELNENTEKLPQQKLLQQKWGEEKRQAEKQQAQARERCTIDKQRFQEAKDNAQKLYTSQKRVQELEKELDTAKKELEKWQEKQHQLEEKEATQLALQKELQEAPQQVSFYKNEEAQLKELQKKQEDLQGKENAIKELCRQEAEAQRQYNEAKKVYTQESHAYENAYQQFLDQQAGVLAKEQLYEGQPCPVCGSLDHPKPANLDENSQVLSRSELDKWQKKVQQLQKKREDASFTANQYSVTQTLKQTQWEKEKQELQGKIKEILPPDIPSIDAFLLVVQNEKKRWEEKNNRLNEAREFVEHVAEKKEKLQQEVEKAGQREREKSNQLLQAQTEMEQYLKNQKGVSLAEAEEAFKQARATKDEAEKTFAYWEKQYQQISALVEKTAGFIEQEKKELPLRQEDKRKKEAQYHAELTKYKLSESEWKSLVSTYEQEQSSRWQQTVTDFEKNKAFYQGRKKENQDIIGDTPRPNLVELKEQLSQAQNSLDAIREKNTELRNTKRDNQEALKEMEQIFDARQDGIRRLECLDKLYKKVAGKMPGQRVSLEGYVQRQYLQYILYAANRRLRRMSDGEYELRLLPLGEKSNGENSLDLRVYSAVTGGERSLATLSGGESFMAALAIAMGLSDQIQDTMASKTLDFMFLDEGFGSLDDHARGHAVRVLKEMAGSEKLIGIISHVTELKQDIEDQLVVTKDQNGSHAKWRLS